MKLNNSELRQLFLLNIQKSIPKTRKECPSPNQMLRLFRGKISEKKKTKIIDHITDCCHCVQEFEFILKALRFENDMNQVVQTFVRTKKSKALSHQRLSWKLAPFAAGAALICILLVISILPVRYKNQRFRASTAPQIDLFKPQEKTIHKSTLFFQWENINNSEYFILELYDETLYQIYASNKIYENNYRLPKDKASLLEVNKSYFWMISAFLPNGRKIESPLKEIFLVE
jgi:hypothetical protein